jgi:hypothetical protein
MKMNLAHLLLVMLALVPRASLSPTGINALNGMYEKGVAYPACVRQRLIFDFICHGRTSPCPFTSRTMTLVALAERHRMHVNTVSRIVQRLLATGAGGPLPHGGGRDPILGFPELIFLSILVQVGEISTYI